MIALIGEHAMLGVAVTVNEAEYETWFNGRGRILEQIPVDFTHSLHA
jgi:hypothetical protein